MKQTLLVLLLLQNMAGVYAQQNIIDTHLEPKATFEIMISGKKYLLTEGEEIKINEVLDKPTLAVKIAERKKFNNNSISFDYPKHLTFQYEREFAFSNWTLSGNNTVVMVFELDVKAPVNSIMAEIIKKFGSLNCKIDDFQKQLGPRKLKGKRLNVTLAEVKLRIDFYEIESADKKSRFIAFQDYIEESTGEVTDEGKIVFEMVNSTIKY